MGAITQKATPKKPRVDFSVRFNPETRQALEKLAEANDRSVAAEIRRAVVAHLEREAA